MKGCNVLGLKSCMRWMLSKEKEANFPCAMSSSIPCVQDITHTHPPILTIL